MRLQLIASELQQTIDPLNAIREKFLEVVSVKPIETEADIDSLLAMQSSLINGSFVQQYEVVNTTAIKNQARLAKTYYDINSAMDNFI